MGIMRKNKETPLSRKEQVIEDERLLGENYLNPFGTRDLEVFEDKLRVMRYEEMLEMAGKLGISTRQSSRSIVASLKQEFLRRYGSSEKKYGMEETKKNETFDHLSDEDRDEIKDLLYVRKRYE